MKIKVKDGMNDIRLKLNHREFMLIFNSLMFSDYFKDVINFEEENVKLFDYQKFKNRKEYVKEVNKLVNKMSTVVDSIIVY